MKIILVCGGRNFSDYDKLKKALDAVHYKHRIGTIIQGGAKGADTLAHQWAMDNEIKSVTVPAEWSQHGKKAGPLRNKEMLKFKPDAVVAFDGGKGTQHMVDTAEREGIPVWQP